MLGQAASMMMANGKMEENELAVLRGIADRLGVGEADVERILSNPGEVDLTLPQAQMALRPPLLCHPPRSAHHPSAHNPKV